MQVEKGCGVGEHEPRPTGVDAPGKVGEQNGCAWLALKVWEGAGKGTGQLPPGVLGTTLGQPDGDFVSCSSSFPTPPPSSGSSSVYSPWLPHH